MPAKRDSETEIGIIASEPMQNTPLWTWLVVVTLLKCAYPLSGEAQIKIGDPAELSAPSMGLPAVHGTPYTEGPLPKCKHCRRPLSIYEAGFNICRKCGREGDVL